MKNEETIFINNQGKIFIPNYESKILMTENEKKFFKVLQYFNNEYIVLPQINLASIVNKTNTKYCNELFRNIDYGIFDKNYKLLLLIELNDRSHLKEIRKTRDNKVKEICKNANIPLMTFYSWYPNRFEYVINRIESQLKKTTT